LTRYRVEAGAKRRCWLEGGSGVCRGPGGAERTREEHEHVWEGSTHPEGEVELGDGEKCEENPCAGAETA
jgi:hypothetical protein